MAREVSIARPKWAMNVVCVRVFGNYFGHFFGFCFLTKAKIHDNVVTNEMLVLGQRSKFNVCASCVCERN